MLGQRPPWPELCSAATDDLGPGAPACARPTRGTRRHGSGDPARTQGVGSHPDGVPRWPPRGQRLFPSVPPPLTAAGLVPGPPTGFPGPRASLRPCPRALSPRPPLQGDLAGSHRAPGRFCHSAFLSHTQSAWTLVCLTCMCVEYLMERFAQNSLPAVRRGEPAGDLWFSPCLCWPSCLLLPGVAMSAGPSGRLPDAPSVCGAHACPLRAAFTCHCFGTFRVPRLPSQGFRESSSEHGCREPRLVLGGARSGALGTSCRDRAPLLGLLASRSLGDFPLGGPVSGLPFPTGV